MQLSHYGSSYTTMPPVQSRGPEILFHLRVISWSSTQIYTNFCFKKLINRKTCLTNESSSARALFHYFIYWKRVHGFISHLSELSSVLLVLLLLHYLWAVSRELRLAVSWQDYKHLTNIFCWGNQCTLTSTTTSLESFSSLTATNLPRFVFSFLYSPSPSDTSSVVYKVLFRVVEACRSKKALAIIQVRYQTKSFMQIFKNF